MFIDSDYIENLLENAKGTPKEEVTRILDKADSFKGLSHEEVASLLMCEDPDQISRIYEIAGKNMADESSFRHAVYLAIDVFRHRVEYDEPLAQPLEKLYHEKRDDSEKTRFNIPKAKPKDNQEQ